MRGWVEELLERLRRSQPASINTIHTFLPSSFSSSSSLCPSSNLQLSVRALLGAYVLAAFTGDLVSKPSTLKKEFTMMPASLYTSMVINIGFVAPSSIGLARWNCCILIIQAGYRSSGHS